MKFFETRFMQRKMVGLRLLTIPMIYKMVLNGIHEL